MGFRFVKYDNLAKNVRESVATELRSHDLDPKNLKKSFKALSVNHAERAIQCQYLLTTLECLDKSSKSGTDKERILNAAVYYVREQISQSYTESLASLFLSPENSTLYNALTTSLDLNNENMPTAKELVEMYGALGNYMQSHVYKGSDSKNGYLESDQQPFSKAKIKGFDVEDVLKYLVTKIAEFKLVLIDLTKEEERAKRKKVPKKSGVAEIGVFGVKGSRVDLVAVANEDQAVMVM